MSARFDSQSMILPLPSSPHWAPITVTLDMSYYRTLIKPRKRTRAAVLLWTPLGPVPAYSRCEAPRKGLSAACHDFVGELASLQNQVPLRTRRSLVRAAWQLSRTPHIPR